MDALQVRSIFHSIAGYNDSVIIGPEHDESQVQIRGFKFDSSAFVFNWEDNSMEVPGRHGGGNWDYFLMIRMRLTIS